MMLNIQYVNQPRVQGGKYGSLRMRDGSRVMCPSELLSYFQPNTSLDVPVAQQTWKDPTTGAENPVLVVSGPPGGAQQPAQGQPAATGYQPRVPYAGAQRPAYGARPTAFQPKVFQGGGGQGLAPGNPNQAREIFVTGVVGRAMGSGKFTASEITVLTQAAAEAWQRLISPPPVQAAAQQPSQQLNAPQQAGYGVAQQAMQRPENIANYRPTENTDDNNHYNGEPA